MTDERDDEILGRALSRAIETIDLNQTPFERSRIANAPARRWIFSVWQMATAVGAIVLALAIGSWLTRPTESQPGVAASPTTAASPSAPAPSATASAVIATSMPTWVYFPRDGLPPVGAFITGYPSTISSRDARIGERVSALRYHATGQVPTGATNPAALIGTNAPGSGGGQTSITTTVITQGDLATVEFGLVPGWGVRGAAQSQALLQQLVYTITEDPGIKRALITETGKPHAVIDQLVIDKPLSREDVSGYVGSQGSGPASTITSGGTATHGLTLATSYSVDAVAPGLARFVVTLTGPDGAAATLPSFSAYLDRTEQPDFGKASIYLELGAEPNPSTGVTVVDRSPLRAIRAVNGFGSPIQVGGPAFVLGLDDARPWRVFTLSNPTRIVVDIGGAPRATSDSVAVYSPRPGDTTGRTLTVSGAARAFEANAAWRVKDSGGREVANGFTTASLGTSALWGTFQTTVTIPTTVSGNVTLEMFWPSPRDGAEMGLVQVPLVVR
jgi:hypothetical protein